MISIPIDFKDTDTGNTLKALDMVIIEYSIPALHQTHLIAAMYGNTVQLEHIAKWLQTYVEARYNTKETIMITRVYR